jgi:hypothetical protein
MFLEKIKIGDKILVFDLGLIRLIEVAQINIDTYDIIDIWGNKWSWLENGIIGYSDNVIEFMKVDKLGMGSE